jgi:tryptophan-rich sensory protein
LPFAVAQPYARASEGAVCRALQGKRMNTLASRSQLRASLLRWALVTVPGVVLFGFLSGQIGGGADTLWFQSLRKPAIYPPAAAFPIVWGILYAVIGFALALVCAAWGARSRGLAIALFAVQLLLNLAWTPLFFGAQQITNALILLLVLDVAVIATTVAFWRVRRTAGLLMLPYLAWVLFATLLNWQFLQLNLGADGAVAGRADAVDRVTL